MGCAESQEPVGAKSNDKKGEIASVNAPPKRQEATSERRETFKSRKWAQKLANTENDDIALLGPRKEAVHVMFTGDPVIGKTVIIPEIAGLSQELKDAQPCTHDGIMAACTWDERVKLYDSHSQEAMRMLREPMYPKVDVLVVGYSPTLSDTPSVSYENVVSWVEEAKKNGCDKPIILCVYKRDDFLQRVEGDLSRGPLNTALLRAQELAEKIGATGFIFTSSKTGLGINQPDTSISEEPKLIRTMILAASNSIQQSSN